MHIFIIDNTVEAKKVKESLLLNVKEAEKRATRDKEATLVAWQEIKDVKEANQKSNIVDTINGVEEVKSKYGEGAKVG